MSQKITKKKLSRRSFIKGAAVGAGAGALALTGLSAKDAKALPLSKVPRWNYEADIIVLGTGAAGFVTAITAHDKGAKVIVLEKATEAHSGGNTRVSANLLFGPTNADDAVTYLTALCDGYPVPEDMVKTWAKYMVENTRWLEKMGGKVENVGLEPEFPEFPGNTCFPGYLQIIDPEHRGSLGRATLWKLLKSNVLKRGIKVMYETRGKKLIQNPETKEIYGVVSVRNGKDLYFKARRAVALCTGGFENNQEMIRDYLHWTCGYPKGTPYNTGDGIKMAMAAGADLWHMGNVAGPDFNFKAPEFDFSFGFRITPRAYGWIVVGKDNKRFVDDKVGTRHGKVLVHDTWVECPEPVPMHMIFDETTRKSGPLYGGMLGTGWNWWSVMESYVWSDDSSKEIEKGWIIKADTIRDLAVKVGRDPKALEEAVNKYNQYCAAGADPDYGTPKKKLVPIVTPPYYAMEMVPSITNTQGGPRHNKDSQVLDLEGNSIPRLYAAGELGSIHSHCYQGGGNLGECIAFGRIAGDNAAKEKPWS